MKALLVALGPKPGADILVISKTDKPGNSDQTSELLPVYPHLVNKLL